MSQVDPTDIFDEEERATEAQAAAEQETRWELADLAWLMNSLRGRRFMWRLLNQAGVYRSSFDRDGSVTAFNEGQRNLGLRYLALLMGHCSESYGSMVQERSNVRS